ncbi:MULTISPECIES: hypothetical protein [Yersinia]|uniref:hypothetical protein n=1 Tax=Yersinia TaxID=629 RepID=UPI0011AAB2BF|nr:hypothetical protein [Yersinia kristensenii]MBW5812513.1 hypothetical protein [Yersinia kristensenii]MBW5817892.1 hypothetical protein [Yersinia kristensenii]MBW5829814.1 hypothetical protein [Yersinia kristensenii]MBW5842208.1 hypothetical protein [Yersinia kristensenii]MDA5490332.1 hypothetical protein [Yersinia kristensenii]
MSGYIYLPIPTQEMHDFCDFWTLGQKEKGKTPYRILENKHSGVVKKAFRYFDGVLSNVNPFDKVYILIHGDAFGSSYIGASLGAKKVMVRGSEEWTGGTLKKYSPIELAQLLKKESLPLNFVDLRLYACGSGLIPKKEGITASFAQRLANELRNIGYINIKVTGYLGTLQSVYSIRQLSPDTVTDTMHKGVYLDYSLKPASLGKIIF